MTAGDELSELRAAADRARTREAEVAGEARRRQRELTAALHEREALDRAAGAGGELDPEAEARLSEALAAPGVEQRRRDPGGRVVVDVRAEARLEGAREALAEAEAAVREHARAHLDDLLDEASEGATAARDELASAVAVMEAAERSWREVAGRAPKMIALAAADQPEAQELRAALEGRGWRFPAVPVGLDGQALADYEAANARDPEAHLPISRTGGEAA